MILCRPSVEFGRGLLKVVELGHLNHIISPYFCLVKTFLIQFGQLNHTSVGNPWAYKKRLIPRELGHVIHS